MSNYPIWCEVYAPNYKSSKDFGARANFRQSVYVGTSPSNSHYLGELAVYRRLNEDGDTEFRMFCNGDLVKKGILKDEEMIWEKV